MPSVSDLLPFVPNGVGHVPLFCAIEWIATRGGTKVVSDADGPTWKAAGDELLLTIVKSRVAVFGVKVPSGVRSTAGIEFTARGKIESSEFADCIVISNPHEPGYFDVEVGDADLLLRVTPYEIDGGWQKDGMSDELIDRNGYVRWTKLTLLRDDVLREWKFDGAEEYRTGERGQPTLESHILAELEAMHRQGQLPQGVGKAARAIAQKIKLDHPNFPKHPKPDSVEDIIRVPYWELRGGKK